MVNASRVEYSAADFIVTDVNGSPGVINGHTHGIVGTYASYSAAVNGAIGAASSTRPTSIWIDPVYADDETGTITINKTRIHLYSGIHNAMDNSSTWWTGTTTGMKPRFLRVTIDSSSVEIRACSISGLVLRELDFYANTNSMHNILVESCGFWPTTATSTSAFYFRGAETINYLTVNNCWIVDGCTAGAIRFTQTTDPGSGQYYFNGLHYKPDVSNATMVVMDTASRISQILVFNELDHVNFASGHKFFWFKDSTYDKGIRVINSSIEEHVSVTLFQIDAGHATRLQHHALEFSHNSGTLAGSGDGVGVFTVITNNAVSADFSNGIMSYLHGHMNRFMSSYIDGTLTAGTPAEHARFSYDLGYVYYNILTETNVVGTTG